ncbi:hypothetical protein JCM8547_008065 [Rhodosporidiobolus lusitaniae]
MPKSSKHKKERKADFTKAKLKLGKGKQVAANATNTSFQAKSIALPSQSLATAVPSTVPTSRRNLTLPDLLVQCRHYSIPTKREALTEILQLLTNHPFLLTQHLLPLTTTVAHLIPDASASVREKARETLRFMSESLSQGQLVSVSPGIVLFTLSALSSLDDPVRIDALKVLDLLLAVIPAEITRGWDGTADLTGSSGAGVDLLAVGSAGKEGEEKATGMKVVEALLGMLKVRSIGLQKAQGAFTTQAAGSDLSPPARLAVLTTLSTFLRASLCPSSTLASSMASTSSDPWYLSTSFPTPRSYATFLSSFGSSSLLSSAHWNVPVSPPPRGEKTSYNTALSHPVEPFSLALSAPTDDLALSSFGLFTSPATPVASSSSSFAAPAPAQANPSLLTLLHPLLLSSFLDAAPTGFSPSASLALSTSSSSRAEAVETVEAVLGVARELFYTVLGGAAPSTGGEGDGTGKAGGERKEARKNLLALLSHAAPYFPFGSDASLSGSSRAEEDRYLALNLRFAELSSLLVLTEREEGGGKKGGKDSGKGGKGEKERERKERVEGVLVERVQEWVVAALNGELTTPTSPLGLPLSAQSFSALEPTLWALLNQPDAKRAEEVWNAVLGMFVRGGGGGETRKRVWEFAARAILLQSDPSYLNRFDLSLSLPRGQEALTKDAPLAKWLATIPKWMWELGGKDEGATELVLSFLLRLASQSPSPSSPLPSSFLLSLLPFLPPFFHLLHPSRGPIPGPFCRLPFAVQGKAMDLGVWLARLAREEGREEEGGKLGEAVRRAVESLGEGEEAERVRGRWDGIKGGW